MERYQFFENLNPFCPELEKTCCTRQDFLALSNWWQTNKVSNRTCSRQSLRQHHTHSIIYYTKMLIKKFKNFQLLANRIVKRASGPSDFCVNAAKNFLSNSNNKLIASNEFLNNYQGKQRVCFELTNKLQLNVLCGLCNSKWDKTLNFKEKKINLNKQACKDVSLKCRDTIYNNLNIIYPFLRYLEPLVRCSPDGDFDKNLKKLT